MYMKEKSINNWKKLFANAINLKYSKDFENQDKRLEYLKQELEDVIIARKVEKNILRVVEPESKEGHVYTDVNERIAGLLANIFVLMHIRNTDTEKELQKALDWFLDKNTKASSEKS